MLANTKIRTVTSFSHQTFNIPPRIATLPITLDGGFFFERAVIKKNQSGALTIQPIQKTSYFLSIMIQLFAAESRVDVGFSQCLLDDGVTQLHFGVTFFHG